ncbi:MAG: hypothetical protein KF713_01385 [Turneriella sp.]|nr:hypothetical protein [Turneriella sp.]
MKKLISVFAAVALVGSIAAAPKKPVAPAKPAVAAPVAAAPAAPSVASMTSAAKALGLHIGIGGGYETNVLNRSGQSVYGGLAGGGGVTDFVSRLNSGNLCGTGGLGVTGATACSATGDGKKTSTAGIDMSLNVRYDFGQLFGLPIFIRSGFTYVLGMKNTYSISVDASLGSSNTLNQTLTYNSESSVMEIPALIGFELVKTDKGSVYVAGGINYSIGTFKHSLAAQDTGTGAYAASTKTWTTVENEIKGKTIGIQYIVGGTINLTSNVTLFGELKWLKSADSSATISGASFEASKASTYASDHPLLSALPQSAKTTLDITGSNPQPLRGLTNADITAAAGKNTLTTNGTVMNLGYDARFVVGVNYSL